MNNTLAIAPDSTAVRVALWRALHVEVDAAPHVIDDEIGIKLVAPEDGWRERPDMHPEFTKVFRASVVARARFIEDSVEALAQQGIHQYVILGAGLDTFAQRRPSLASNLQVYEVDQPGHQAWKQKRLVEAGYGIPDWQHFVPVDFEAGDSWMEQLVAAGFDVKQPAVIASTGVSMYLTREAIVAMFHQIATLAPKTCFIMTFLLPIEMADPEVQFGLRRAESGAKASGTPFISYFTPEQMIALVNEVGFSHVEHVSANQLAEKYFTNRADGLRPPTNSEEIIVVTV
ncbi:class I SAM-dependent methyltransferase [Aquirhabdus sp.]|uniref:class I SAM-dependent methyltransferase n=1 Tax=Aquirhabdus sp. TaxID=2824160 RepID=UPI00396CA4EE